MHAHFALQKGRGADKAGSAAMFRGDRHLGGCIVLDASICHIADRKGVVPLEMTAE